MQRTATLQASASSCRLWQCIANMYVIPRALVARKSRSEWTAVCQTCELPEAAGHRNMQSSNDSHVHRARQYNNATYSKLEAAWMCLARVVCLALILHSCEAGNHLPDRSILLPAQHSCLGQRTCGFVAFPTQRRCSDGLSSGCIHYARHSDRVPDP
jgi:hypothetical protein